MKKGYGEVGPNDCFVTDNVMSSARNLIDGSPLSPINFADLCELIEMAIIHERIIMTIPPLYPSSLEDLNKEGVVTSTMFKHVMPPEESDRELLRTIYRRCLRTVKEGGVFGRGILDKSKSHTLAQERAVQRIQFGELVVGVESGRRKLHPDEKQSFAKLLELYGVFKEYADAVFDAAQHFHVHAYAGTSELPYSIQKTVKIVPPKLYQKLQEIHKDRVDPFLASVGYKSFDIPPFSLIVLSRCKRRKDIVPEILRAREEFSNFRETCTAFAIKIRDAALAGTFEDIIDLYNDYDKAIEVFAKKAKASRKDSRFVYRVWNVLKHPSSIAVNLLDRLKDYDIKRQHLRTINGMMDVWKKLRKASTYNAILRSDLFRNEFSQQDFRNFNEYLIHVRQYLPVAQRTGNAFSQASNPF